jgi:hypothetical protein
MRLFYFIGGPKPGHAAQYWQRLMDLGELPPGWRVYPWISRDGKALHLVHENSPEAIYALLQKLAPFYEYSEIMEIIEV